MIIRNVKKEIKDGRVKLSADARVRCWGWDNLYLDFDEKYSDFIYEDASPFAAALLVPSMCLGEDLIIEGSLSQELSIGLERIIDTMASWDIGLKRIKIKARELKKDEASPDKVASFFSGGVDSFYSYLKHKDDAIDPISHLVLIRGNDIDLRNEKLWLATRDHVRKIAEEGGVELIEVESNIRQLIEPIIVTDYAHGGVLAAIALGLRRGLKKMYIPSSFSTNEEIIPWGSRPDIDRYWGTGIISFEHDGVEARRIDKIEWQIARSPLALKHLRVCYMNVNGNYNCGRCEKCLNTMIGLYAFDCLKDASTFPKQIDLGSVARIVENSGVNASLHQENLEALEKKRLNPELQAEIKKGLAKASDPRENLCNRLFAKLFYYDHRYLFGFFYGFWIGHLRSKIFKEKI
jgi:hypothetical protein